MFLLPLVLARWAKVLANGCGSGTFVLDNLKDAGTNSFVPISDPFEDMPSCFRTGAECGKALAAFSGPQRLYNKKLLHA